MGCNLASFTDFGNLAATDPNSYSPSYVHSNMQCKMLPKPELPHLVSCHISIPDEARGWNATIKRTVLLSYLIFFFSP
jgi:hypothetical protein